MRTLITVPLAVLCLTSAAEAQSPGREVFENAEYRGFLAAIYDGRPRYDVFGALFGRGERDPDIYAAMAYATLVSYHSDAIRDGVEGCRIEGDVAYEFTVDGRVVALFHVPESHEPTLFPIMNTLGPYPIHWIKPDIDAFFAEYGCASPEFVRLRERLHRYIDG